jgi:hypothetical protein
MMIVWITPTAVAGRSFKPDFDVVPRPHEHPQDMQRCPGTPVNGVQGQDERASLGCLPYPAEMTEGLVSAGIQSLHLSHKVRWCWRVVEMPADLRHRRR